MNDKRKEKKGKESYVMHISCLRRSYLQNSEVFSNFQFFAMKVHFLTDIYLLPHVSKEVLTHGIHYFDCRSRSDLKIIPMQQKVQSI